jgi:hypothetical protein
VAIACWIGCGAAAIAAVAYEHGLTGFLGMLSAWFGASAFIGMFAGIKS